MAMDKANQFVLEDWEDLLNKMIRYHFNIGEEVKTIVQTIRKEMKQDMVPQAEDRAHFGAVVRGDIRSMWDLEYEIQDLQVDFAKKMGEIDLHNLTDDFVEDVMLQSKPLQGVLKGIRGRQVDVMKVVKDKYWDQIKELEPMKITRPPKPMPPPPAPEKKEEAAAPAPPPAEPAPAVDAAAAPAAVEASA